MAVRKPKRDLQERYDTHVYLDPPLWRAIAEAAKKNDRSVTGEIRYLLRQTYMKEAVA